MKILVVDDDPRVRDTLEFMLDAIGHEVSAAADGLEGWARFQTSGVDVVFTDWMMPGMDGLDLCTRIREAGRDRYTYVIILTALDGPDNYLAGMDAGADDFVTKPCSQRELQARLRVAERVLNLQGQVRTLEGLLPICSYCKQMRDDDGSWLPIEEYIAARTDADFTHGICPTCQVAVEQEIERWQAANPLPQSA